MPSEWDETKLSSRHGDEEHEIVGGLSFLFPLSVAIYSTFLPVMPPVTRLHLIGGAFSLNGRDRLD